MPNRSSFLVATIVPAVTIVLAVTSSAARAQDESCKHLFILSGQSNMAGMNPEHGFKQEAEKLLGDVAYIKVARGGQPIRYWVTEWDDIAKKHEIDVQAKRAKDRVKGTLYYQPILDQFKQLLSKHPSPRSVTFCWMQGERDAKEHLHEAYADSLKQLISNLRRDLEQPEMHFVIGRLSDFGDGKSEQWQSVRNAQLQVANEDARGAWVDCDDLNDKPNKNGEGTRNDLHYTKEGYRILGERYARQAHAMMNGNEPASDGRPN